MEIGARGAVHELDCKMAYDRMCSKLGFTGKARIRLTKGVHLFVSLSQDMGASAVAGHMEIIGMKLSFSN